MEAAAHRTRHPFFQLCAERRDFGRHHLVQPFRLLPESFHFFLPVGQDLLTSLQCLFVTLLLLVYGLRFGNQGEKEIHSCGDQLKVAMRLKPFLSCDEFCLRLCQRLLYAADVLFGFYFSFLSILKLSSNLFKVFLRL